MNSKNAFLLFGFIGLLIAYIIYNEKIVFSGNEGLNEVNFNNKNLKHIDAPFPISHILKLNDELFSFTNSNHFYKILFKLKIKIF